MLTFLSYIGNFFKFLWRCISTSISFVLTLPGLIVTSVSTLYVSIRSVFSALYGGNTLLADLVSRADSSVDSISTLGEGMSPVGNLAIYALSLDTLFGFAGTIFTFILTFFVAVVTFLIIAVPLFLVQYYALKISAKVFIALMPSSWVPVQVLDWVRYNASDFISHHAQEFSLKGGHGFVTNG